MCFGSSDPRGRSSRHVVLSGCSGGGKSTLQSELRARGLATVPEPGRRVVEEALRGDGATLPWRDMTAFARRALALARADRAALADARDLVFFDRGLVDAAAALRHAAGVPLADTLRRDAPYHERVFLAPPWPDIYRGDAERRHGFQEAAAEYERLVLAYRELGYRAIVLPKATVCERADFVLAALAAEGGTASRPAD